MKAAYPSKSTFTNTLFIVRFKNKTPLFFYTVYACFSKASIQKTAIISPYRIQEPVSIMEAHGTLCEVQSKILCKMLDNITLRRVNSGQPDPPTAIQLRSLKRWFVCEK